MLGRYKDATVICIIGNKTTGIRIRTIFDVFRFFRTVSYLAESEPENDIFIKIECE